MHEMQNGQPHESVHTNPHGVGFCGTGFETFSIFTGRKILF